MNGDEMKMCREAFDKWFFAQGYCITGSPMYAMALLAWMESWQAAQPKWLPIESIPLEQYHGYSVSNNVLLAIQYKETNIKVGRVWEENGKRTLPDNKYDDYSLVTHYMPLPTPPKQEQNT